MKTKTPEQHWKRIEHKLRAGTELRDGSLRVVKVDEKGITAERPKTGSIVRASRAMIEKTATRLDAGEFLPRRSISYTVAIETLVLEALGKRVSESTVDGARGYRGSV